MQPVRSTYVGVRQVTVLAALLAGLAWAAPALAQFSSLGVEKRERDAERTPAERADAEAQATRQAVANQGRPHTHPAYARYSWITAQPLPPPSFEVEDLITIIVRERSQFEADANSKAESKYDVKSDVESFPKLLEGGIGAATFSRGQPNLDYKFEAKSDRKADAARDDSFTTRITGRIVDIKPNGLLVIEAKAKLDFSGEEVEITLTGNCRKEDVTADNTVLSTQLADKDIKVKTDGTVHHGSRPGWLTKLFEAIKPI